MYCEYAILELCNVQPFINYNVSLRLNMVINNVRILIRNAESDTPHSDEKFFHSKYISLSYYATNIDAIIIIMTMVIPKCYFNIDQIDISLKKLNVH